MMDIMHSTVSLVFLCLVRFIISCFYQLINFLANCRHLRSISEYLEHLRAYQSVLLFLIALDRSRSQGLATFRLFTVRHKSRLSANTALPHKFVAKIVRESGELLDNRTRIADKIINGRDTRKLSEKRESFSIIVLELRTRSSISENQESFSIIVRELRTRSSIEEIRENHPIIARAS